MRQSTITVMAGLVPAIRRGTVSLLMAGTSPAMTDKPSIMARPVQVHVIGASGRTGVALSASLLADELSVVPVLRNPAKWTMSVPPRIADLNDPTALRAALADATHIVCCAHARHAGVVIDAAPPDARLIFLGSTRKFTKWLDPYGAGVLAGELAFLASGRSGVMLHPTMIYGAQGEDNVQRLASLLRRLPFVPLPGGGKALVQPIHQDDVTRAIQAALDHPWDGPQSLVIAGPTPLPYADFVRAVATAAGLRRPHIIPVPARLLMAAVTLLPNIPRVPQIHREEIRRLLEDKAFDVRPMKQTLGVRPIPLPVGLARTFTSQHNT
jgi:nucleoside-diphosphate-sugar epimerase